MNLHTIPFVPARHFRAGRRKPVRLIVLHDMEAAETTKTAENVAKWWNGPASPVSSAHYCVDSDSIVCCVRPEDTAFHAPGANEDGIGIELAGYARQTAAEWADAYSTAMLARAAELVASLCSTYELPVALVDVFGLQHGATGITTHALVSKAFKKSTHSDPGPSFPMAAFLDQVLAAKRRLDEEDVYG